MTDQKKNWLCRAVHLVNAGLQIVWQFTFTIMWLVLILFLMLTVTAGWVVVDLGARLWHGLKNSSEQWTKK